jgi:ABC-type phosphate/phosphonate transport system substrate-binding protein
MIVRGRPEVALAWRALLTEIGATSGLPLTIIDHPAPAPLDLLWNRTDKAAVFMCGLPFSRAEPRPVLVAAPIPAAAEFGGLPQYWSEFVVRETSPFQAVEDTFGKRIAFTVPDSQSGCVAALTYFLSAGTGQQPLFKELVAPTTTPLGALRAIVDGAADVAPIDAYALRLLQKYRPDLTSRIRIVGRTIATPIPPLVGSTDEPALQAAFLAAHHNGAVKPLLDQLLLQGFARPDPDTYAVLRERFVAATQYWHEHPIAAVVHPAFIM